MENIAKTNVNHIRENPWYKNGKFQKRLFILMVLIPCCGGYLLFTIYPNILSAYYSLLKWDGISKPQFIGLDNYARLFSDPYVWRALSHNFILLLLTPVLTILISLILAYLLVNKTYRERNIHKVLYFLPNVMSSVIIALMWRFIYDGDYGLINGLFRTLGINIGKFYWLGETQTALLAMVLPAVWSGVGFYVIIFTNAMSTIPKSLYESAIIDGANHMVRLFKITLPLLWGIVRIGLIFTILGVLKGFELILILTNGGPAGSTDVIGLYMFNTAFGDRQVGAGLSGVSSAIPMYGYASAIGMFLFFILVTVNVLIDKYFPNERYEF